MGLPRRRRQARKILPRRTRRTTEDHGAKTWCPQQRWEVSVPDSICRFAFSISRSRYCAVGSGNLSCHGGGESPCRYRQGGDKYSLLQIQAAVFAQPGRPAIHALWHPGPAKARLLLLRRRHDWKVRPAGRRMLLHAPAPRAGCGRLLAPLAWLVALSPPLRFAVTLNSGAAKTKVANTGRRDVLAAACRTHNTLAPSPGPRGRRSPPV